MSAKKGKSEKLKACMLSINSKTDKLIASRAALLALMSKIVSGSNQAFLIPLRLLPPTGGFMSDPRTDVISNIEGGAIFENMEAYMRFIDSQMHKLCELQVASKAMTDALIKKIAQACPDFPIQSVYVPLPRTGGLMSDPQAAEVGVLAWGGSAGGLIERMETHFLRFSSNLDKVIESEASLRDMVNDLVTEIVCPKCLNQLTGKSLSAPLPSTGIFTIDPSAVGGLVERLRLLKSMI